jgi:putative transposase
MHRYLGAVSAHLDCPVIRVGGIADHVHCLARQSRTITVPEWVKELKRAASQWAKTQSPSLVGLQWQAGYGAFSVSQSLSHKVEQYIEEQEEHHRRFDFQTELRKLLAAHGVEYDERYLPAEASAQAGVWD